MLSSRLAVGIVGLPNVGKSTLFNALLKKQQAYAANFPFATIEPNIGIVPVPDNRLDLLVEVIKSSEGVLPPKNPATIEFVDIAGLVAGAHKGEGLGNKFLAHIREVDAIVHVVRGFKDPDIVRAGSVDMKSDLETIKLELDLADMETEEKSKGKKQNAKVSANSQDDISRNLFRNKPYLVVLNVDEEDLQNAQVLENNFAETIGVSPDQIVAVCAKTEAELANLGDHDAKLYLQDLGVEESGLERLIKKAFATLGLITFLTAGVKEVRAWTIPSGINAQNSAGVIHTDFIKKFIKAEVVEFNDFNKYGGWRGSREKGKARFEGKEYIMKDGDVVEFKIGT